MTNRTGRLRTGVVEVEAMLVRKERGGEGGEGERGGGRRREGRKGRARQLRNSFSREAVLRDASRSQRACPGLIGIMERRIGLMSSIFITSNFGGAFPTLFEPSTREPESASTTLNSKLDEASLNPNQDKET